MSCDLRVFALLQQRGLVICLLYMYVTAEINTSCMPLDMH